MTYFQILLQPMITTLQIENTPYRFLLPAITIGRLFKQQRERQEQVLYWDCVFVLQCKQFLGSPEVSYYVLELYSSLCNKIFDI